MPRWRLSGAGQQLLQIATVECQKGFFWHKASNVTRCPMIGGHPPTQITKTFVEGIPSLNTYKHPPSLTLTAAYAIIAFPS